MGWLADRFGGYRVFLAGYALLLPLYSLLTMATLSPLGLLVVLVVLGAFYAATDGVLMAVVSAIVPPLERGTAIGTLTTVTTLARLVGSLVFGSLWVAVGLGNAVAGFAVMLAIALVAALLALGTLEGRSNAGASA
jgi:MFS family permease